MNRKELLSSPEYWITKIQIDLYNCAMQYMKQNGLNRKQLAEKLGVSKGYISQLLNGDYDHRLSKLVELSLAFGCYPKLQFEQFEQRVSYAEIKEITKISKIYKEKFSANLHNVEYKEETAIAVTYSEEPVYTNYATAA